MTKEEQKVEVNKGMIGRLVLVTEGNWNGEIVGVVDGDTVTVKNLLNEKLRDVSIFDLRSLF